MPTYYPATQAEIDAALAAFYSGAPIPNGFAVNLTWPEKVRRIDPDAPAPAWPGWFSDFVPGPGQIVVGGPSGPVKQNVSAVASPGPDTIPLGDSITGRFSGGNGVGGGDHPTLIGLLSGGKIRIVRNAGISGNKTADMLARLQTDVIAYAPDRCIVLGGTNDVGSVSLAASLANLTTIWDTLTQAGVRPIAATVPPKNVNQTQIAQLNAGIRVLAAKRGLTLLDYHSVLVNPATGIYQTAYDSGDGVHPNGGAGALAMAQYAVNTLTTYPAGGPYLTDYVGDGANLITNGLFIGDANSDGLADSWTLGNTGGSVATTIQTGSGSDIGNWQVLTQSAGGQRYLLQEFTTGYSVGDTLEFAGRVVTSGIQSGGMTPSIRLEYNSTGSVMAYAAYQLAADFTGVFRCRGQVPTGTTKIRPMILTSSTGTGVIKVAQLTVTNLTALGVA